MKASKPRCNLYEQGSGEQMEGEVYVAIEKRPMRSLPVLHLQKL